MRNPLLLKIFPVFLEPHSWTKYAANRSLAQLRIPVKPVIRSLKIFRILSERYRNRRRQFGLELNLIAGLYNRSSLYPLLLQEVYSIHHTS